MRSYRKNDQLISLDYSSSIPDKEFYEQMGFPRPQVKPIFKSRSELNGDDVWQKRVFRDFNLNKLVKELEGEGYLIFRYDGKEIDMGSKTQMAQTHFELTNESKEELETIDHLIDEELNKNPEYTWSTNTPYYQSMEDLKDGLSNPISIETEIQGVSKLTYNPNGFVGVQQYRPEMIEISEEILEKKAKESNIEAEEQYKNTLRRKLRSELQDETEGAKEIHLAKATVSLNEDDWRIRQYPIDENTIESIIEELESQDFEVQRIQLGASQQPYDRSLLTQDFEIIN